MITTTSRARSRLARRLSWLVVLALTSAALFVPAASPVFAAAPNPNYESGAPGITVDGNLSEWTSADFFANMYRAGKADKELSSRSCTSATTAATGSCTSWSRPRMT